MESQVNSGFLEYGAIGLLALMCVIAVRILFRQNQEFTQRETERADRLEVALQESHKAMQDTIIPAAIELLNTTKSYIDLIAQERAVQRRGRE